MNATDTAMLLELLWYHHYLRSNYPLQRSYVVSKMMDVCVDDGFGNLLFAASDTDLPVINFMLEDLH